MFGMGTAELVLVLVFVVILFGTGKLPKVAAYLARGIRNFKANSGSGKDEDVDIVEIRESDVFSNSRKKNGPDNT